MKGRGYFLRCDGCGVTHVEPHDDYNGAVDLSSAVPMAGWTEHSHILLCRSCQADFVRWLDAKRGGQAAGVPEDGAAGEGRPE